MILQCWEGRGGEGSAAHSTRQQQSPTSLLHQRGRGRGRQRTERKKKRKTKKETPGTKACAFNKWKATPALVLSVRALGGVCVARQHVVVHVDGGAVVDGVAQTLGQHRLTGVGRQPQLEEAGLGSGQPIHRLQRKREQMKTSEQSRVKQNTQQGEGGSLLMQWLNPPPRPNPSKPSKTSTNQPIIFTELIHVG